MHLWRPVSWFTLTQELKRDKALGKAIEILEMKYKDVIWEPFEAGTGLSRSKLKDLTDILKKRGLIGSQISIAKMEDLRDQTLAAWKETKGYASYRSVYKYLQKLKHDLGMREAPSNDGYMNVPSTLRATCARY